MVIVYSEGLQVINYQKKIIFRPLKICFVLANSADPDVSVTSLFAKVHVQEFPVLK